MNIKVAPEPSKWYKRIEVTIENIQNSKVKQLLTSKALEMELYEESEDTDNATMIEEW